jgi:hypothetical protein
MAGTTTDPVDASWLVDLRSASQDCADRGLIAASKWCVHPEIHTCDHTSTTTTQGHRPLTILFSKEEACVTIHLGGSGTQQKLSIFIFHFYPSQSASPSHRSFLRRRRLRFVRRDPAYHLHSPDTLALPVPIPGTNTAPTAGSGTRAASPIPIVRPIFRCIVLVIIRRGAKLREGAGTG